MARIPKPVDACIGRAAELADMTAALNTVRLATLTGPGGVGKTRVAVEFAWSAVDRYRDGAWFVPLGDLDQSADRASVAAIVLSVLESADQSPRPPDQKLAELLSDRDLLLVLDNCEHLLDSVVPLARDLLANAPGLRLLTTSREPLAITGERVLVIPPLPVPTSVQAENLAELIKSDAARLFVERARAVEPTFSVSEDETQLVARLCAELDGLPLAIELCATRLRSLSVRQVLERLGSTLDLTRRDHRISTRRHRSLRDVIDWSHELCSVAHQVLWARMAVFPASFDITAVEAICAFGVLSPEEIMDGVDRLVARCVLLTENRQGIKRYRMLASIREYAMEKLGTSGEVTILRRRHRDHYLGQISTVVADWARPTKLAALREMDAEHPNYVAALSWSAANEAEQEAGLEFAAKLRYHWLPGGHLAEGRRWLELFLQRPVGAPVRFHGLWVTAWVALLQGDLDGARRSIVDLERMHSEVGTAEVDAHVAHWTGLLEVYAGLTESAVIHLQSAASRHRSRGATALEMSARFMLAYALASADRAEDAIAESTFVIERTSVTGDRFNLGWAWWMKGYAQWRRGNLDAAEEALRAALVVERIFRDRICIAGSVALLCVVAMSRGNIEDARELATTAAGLFSAIGTTPVALGDFARAWTTATTEIAAETGLADFDAAASGVMAVPYDQEVVERILSHYLPARRERTSSLRLSPQGPGTSLIMLTRREREVAELIAQGLTNREIAERLVIAPRTADGHVERILGKLGVHKRTMVAVLVARSRPQTGRDEG